MNSFICKTFQRGIKVRGISMAFDFLPPFQIAQNPFKFMLRIIVMKFMRVPQFLPNFNYFLKGTILLQCFKLLATNKRRPPQESFIKGKKDDWITENRVSLLEGPFTSSFLIKSFAFIISFTFENCRIHPNQTKSRSTQSPHPKTSNIYSF
jgi:hypothetical protein